MFEIFELYKKWEDLSDNTQNLIYFNIALNKKDESIKGGRYERFKGIKKEILESILGEASTSKMNSEKDILLDNYYDSIGFRLASLEWFYNDEDVVHLKSLDLGSLFYQMWKISFFICQSHTFRSDESLFEFLPNLDSLYVSSPKSENLHGMGGSEDITKGVLPSGIKDSLKSLTKLEYVYFYNCYFKNLEVFKENKELKAFGILDSSYTYWDDCDSESSRRYTLRDISSLADLPKLTHLNLDSSLPEDFSAIQSLTKLKYLDISETEFKDLKILLKLKKDLRTVRFHGAKQSSNLDDFKMFESKSGKLVSRSQNPLTFENLVDLMPDCNFIINFKEVDESSDEPSRNDGGGQWGGLDGEEAEAGYWNTD